MVVFRSTFFFFYPNCFPLLWRAALQQNTFRDPIYGQGLQTVTVVYTKVVNTSAAARYFSNRSVQN